MTDNKLYNALLKSQEEQRRSEQRKGEARAEDNFRKERPYAGSDRLKPGDGVHVGPGESEHPPLLYDSSISLSRIGNPKPWSRDQLRERKIIYSGMPDKEVMDAFRELRIQLRSREDGVNLSVLFSSLGSRENSVLTAFNLAAAFALDSHTSALFVDCDPYNRALEKLVSVPLDAGVTDFVSDPALRIKDILYPSGVDRLTVIPAGRQVSSAVELFSAVRMRDLMAELKTRYPDRCLVINAPPFLGSTEARILERFADQIVFGVPFGEVTRDEIAGAVDALDSKKFAGLVFQE